MKRHLKALLLFPSQSLKKSNKIQLKRKANSFQSLRDREIEREVVYRNPMASSNKQEGTTTAKRKPVFTKVDQLKPGTNGHTLVAKVLSSNTVLQKGRPSSSHILRPTLIAECLIGDDTGTIIFTARNDQVDLMKPENTVILRNAKIDMFKGSMRLAVDKWGRIEVTEPANFVVKEDNNLSLVEYELVNVVEE
ncbi:hypothetical protein RJT34_04456 [Clitoria ternatea]|uniref:Single-stranded DNA binding protein Ssb-like OB fold domain-containing protein n=1 Tax=Clitoria ternatea TaxID=43366 RepID=A0AAN9Q292_CLITE